VSLLSVILALGAAALFALGTVLQQKGAMQEWDAEALKAGFLLRLAQKPVWLLGVLADGLGYTAQAAALGVGKLIVVQPLLVASVVFALPLGVRLTGQKIGRREVVGAGGVCLGLAAFSLVSNPSGGQADATDRAWLIGSLVVGGTAALLTLASLGRRPGVRAALLGTAAGVIFGLVAALTKATVDRFDNGFVAVVANWHLYGLIGASVVGFALVQMSLQTGALAPSIATTMVFETIVGVAVGIFMLHEEIHEDAGVSRCRCSRSPRFSAASSVWRSPRGPPRNARLRSRRRPQRPCRPRDRMDGRPSNRRPSNRRPSNSLLQGIRDLATVCCKVPEPGPRRRSRRWQSRFPAAAAAGSSGSSSRTSSPRCEAPVSKSAHLAYGQFTIAAWTTTQRIT
jgi:drug/metabolite transporter (DMT)-like permease